MKQVEPAPASFLQECALTEAKRLLLVDDEPLARQRLRRYVQQSAPTACLAEAVNGLHAVDLIASFQPHVILLDIEMPELNGFEVLAQVARRDFHVIFQTAYDQFAIRAFEANACDYLLKPFTAERLAQALERALTQQAEAARLLALEAQLRARTGYLQQIALRQGLRRRLVPVAELVCFISLDHYTCVYFASDGQYLEGIVDLSLSRLLECLDPEQFQMLHRHSIARVGAIRALVRQRNGTLVAELVNGMHLPVSRRQHAAVSARFEL